MHGNPYIAFYERLVIKIFLLGLRWEDHFRKSSAQSRPGSVESQIALPGSDIRLGERSYSLLSLDLLLFGVVLSQNWHLDGAQDSLHLDLGTLI